MSLLDDLLGAVRVDGAVVLNEAYRAPWSIHVPSSDELRSTVDAPGNAHIVPFHFLRSGQFSIKMNEQVEHIQAGEIAICPGGLDHVMSDGSSTLPIPLTQLIEGMARFSGEGRQSDLVCGLFIVRETPFLSLTTGLPAMFKLPVDQSRGSPIAQSAADLLLASISEPPDARQFVAARALEVFFHALIRDYVAANSADPNPGLFAALHDPKIAHALSLIYADPGLEWSRETIAAEIGLSTSRFAARFKQRVGKSFRQALIEQRMRVASELLLENSVPISQIANHVGYASTATFTRAFTDHFERSPRLWRNQMVQSL